uniref:DUF2415 domain-containing protein n=1 Tax=Kwoniella pini CBS 10737 TaxID=1296096 RepID=A0A1B9IAB7_9TREE|nr:uncharacterized protein I206_01683 [Kwoniella pini CBS 10737]OCF52394.1 hypothetical protein I206_01683 [Kwoniella pini CBS 10737]
MARDPPSLLSSSELRDISLTPTSVRSARITIIHPQLRDLILPLERGRVLYPRGMTIEEQRWLPAIEEEDGTTKRGITGSTRPLLNLNFVPNCLTASSSIFACGGQHGELYICNLPQPTNSNPALNPLSNKYTSSAPKIKPFIISTTLSGRSINNSIIIPPTWPSQWMRTSEEKKLGYLNRGSRKYEELGRYGFEEEELLLGRTENGQWITRKPISLTGDIDDEDQIMDDEDEDEDVIEEDDDDEDTELLSEEEDDAIVYDVAHSPISDSSVATYPNTVPFLHAPRIPHLPNPASTSRTTKGKIEEPRILISNNDCTVKMFSLHPLQPSNHNHIIERSPVSYNADAPQSRRERISPTLNYRQPFPVSNPNERDDLGSRPLDRLGLGAPRSSNSSISRTGTPFEWTSHNHSHHRHHHQTSVSTPFTLAERETLSLQRELQRASDGLRVEHDNLRRSREDFERVIGMRVSTGQAQAGHPRDADQEREERKLSKVGGTRFKVATNHCEYSQYRIIIELLDLYYADQARLASLSPDLKTMVSVGDSTEVTIFEVIDGGREFRKIAVYDAATDAGFSTAWSKDGRKFAVASQDGQVTVWDHRSSQPLAIFHTSPDTSHSSQQPSFIDDISASHLSASPTSSNGSGWNVVGPEGITLRDPITGTPRTGTSTSGKEAARVVKFSPEGSNRDLMAFSEENSNIHLIDAQTFNTHVIIPVPHIPLGTADPDATSKPRQGVENGTWGIAGVGFDPSGDWLYSGTERTVVEWDLRRSGSGGGGVWGIV